MRGGEFLAWFGRESIRMPGPLNWPDRFRMFVEHCETVLAKSRHDGQGIFDEP